MKHKNYLRIKRNIQALLFFLLIVFCTNAYSQGVSINTTGDPADSSAILDLGSSFNKGFLPPRTSYTLLMAGAITNPAEGLLVYCYDNNSSKGLYYYNGHNWEQFVTGKHYIGESFQGGIVFYVYDNGKHGLIAAPSDQQYFNNGSYYSWGNSSFVFATSDGIGAGELNTALITLRYAASGSYNTTDTARYAFWLCNRLTVSSNGISYGGWYLPSLFELNLMYQQKNIIGGFNGDYYWSSNENINNPNQAYALSFFSGTISSFSKFYNYTITSVRAIKEF